MKMRSSSHKYSLIRNQGVGRSYYSSPFACYLDICFWIRFQSNFSHNFGIRTLLLNSFDIRSLCNTFLTLFMMGGGGKKAPLPVFSPKLPDF